MTDTATPAPPELFQPIILQGVVDRLDLPTTFLLSNFFPTTVMFDTRKVMIDLTIGANRVAAFCAPEVQGRVVAESGYRTREFEPAYIKEKTLFTPKNSFKRRAGEQAGMAGNQMSPMDRHMARVSESVNEKAQAIVNRKELMASTILTTGKVTVQGDGYPTTIVDFGRDPSLTIALTGAACWDQDDSNPIADIETWTQMVLLKKGGMISKIILGSRAWAAAWTNEKFRLALHTINYKGASIQIGPNMSNDLTAYKGSIGNTEIWVYSGYYETVDDEGNVTSQTMYIEDDMVVGVGSYLDGQQLHGAIMDERAGLKAMEYFAKSWISEDPSGRIVMVQSAPLVAPRRPNNSFCAKVLS